MTTARSVRRAYDLALEELGINLSEASVLAALGNHGVMTQTRLAERLGMGRARIGVHIDTLEARDAVRREADPDDRRVWLVTLTASGEQLWERAVQIDKRVRARLRAGTTAQDRDKLDDLLHTIQSNCESLLEQSGSWPSARAIAT